MRQLLLMVALVALSGSGNCKESTATTSLPATSLPVPPATETPRPSLPYPHNYCLNSAYELQDYPYQTINERGEAKIPIKWRNEILILNLRTVGASENVIHTAFVFYDHNKHNERFEAKEFLLTGYVEGYKNSKVFGSLIGGIFDGRVNTTEKQLTIERFDRHSNKDQEMFHSLDYADGEFKAGCVITNALPLPTPPLPLPRPQLRTMENDDSSDDNTRTCNVKVFVDHLMFDFLSEKVRNESEFLRNQDGEAKPIDVELRIRQELISRLFSSFSFVNEVLNNSPLPSDVKLNFTVGQIIIYGDCQKEGAKFCRESTDPSDELSQMDLEAFCLGLLMTKRTLFARGSLAAGIASINGACGPSFVDSSQRRNSSNFLTVSGGIGGATFPSRINQHVLLHELSHTIGAIHSLQYKNSSCVLDGQKKTFIMDKQLIDVGTTFSQCSLDRMAKFLRFTLGHEPEGHGVFFIDGARVIGRNWENCFGSWDKGREVIIAPPSEEGSADDNKNFKPKEQSKLEALGGWFQEKFQDAISIF